MEGTSYATPLLTRPEGWLNAAHLARVVSVDDPERMNRVQIGRAHV